MPVRCRSNCTNNKTPASCKAADKCSYTNGAVRKFCRLSSKYKMNPPECNITRKFLKREKGAAEKIRRFLERKRRAAATQKKVRKGPTEEELREFTNKVHTRRLERFMRKIDPHKLRANVRAKYLNAICSDAGVCIAFDKEVNKIKKHFGRFVKFDNVESLRKIGAVSANGFVKELEYENAGYKAHAVLKSSTKPEGDNLYYEYLVGEFINGNMEYLPNFVETYGVYKYNNDSEYEEMKKLTAGKDTLLGLSLIRTPSDAIEKGQYIKERNLLKIAEQHIKEKNLLKIACQNSKHISILIQHIKDAQSLVDKCQNTHFVTHDLGFVLFQVYWALYILKENFTHYDLHTENVLIYEPVKDSYIQYFYHLQNGSVISFKSAYIAKLIDYGRSYYDYKGPGDVRGRLEIEDESKYVYKEVCKIPECKPRCGHNYGFAWFKTNDNICSQRPNISQDLRLLYMLHKSGHDFGGSRYVNMCNNIETFAEPLHKLCKTVKFNTMYSTPAKKTKGYPTAIHNIKDAFYSLSDLVQIVGYMENNQIHYAGKTKLGEMHIYEEPRPLEYISAV